MQAYKHRDDAFEAFRVSFCWSSADILPPLFATHVYTFYGAWTIMRGNACVMFLWNTCAMMRSVESGRPLKTRLHCTSSIWIDQWRSIDIGEHSECMSVHVLPRTHNRYVSVRLGTTRYEPGRSTAMRFLVGWRFLTCSAAQRSAAQCHVAHRTAWSRTIELKIVCVLAALNRTFDWFGLLRWSTHNEKFTVNEKNMKDVWWCNGIQCDLAQKEGGPKKGEATVSLLKDRYSWFRLQMHIKRSEGADIWPFVRQHTFDFPVLLQVWSNRYFPPFFSRPFDSLQLWSILPRFVLINLAYSYTQTPFASKMVALKSLTHILTMGFGLAISSTMAAPTPAASLLGTQTH